MDLIDKTMDTWRDDLRWDPDHSYRPGSDEPTFIPSSSLLKRYIGLENPHCDRDRARAAKARFAPV